MKEFSFITFDSKTHDHIAHTVKVKDDASLDELQQAIASATGVPKDQLKV